MSEPLYVLRVNGPRREQLAHMTGTRETVIEAGLRIILDCAPYWNAADQFGSPAFTFDVYRVNP